MPDETVQPGPPPADRNDEPTVSPPTPGRTPPSRGAGRRRRGGCGPGGRAGGRRGGRGRGRLAARSGTSAGSLAAHRGGAGQLPQADAQGGGGRPAVRGGGLLRELLEVLDNFERATISMRESGAGEDELENLKNGVQLIHQRFATC